MKQKNSFALFFLATALTAVAQEESRLVFNPELPKAGEATELIYTPLPSMTGNQTINGVAYTYRDGKWYGHDICLKNEGSVWKGSFTPEPKTGFMAFKFFADTIVDNNDGMTFATMLNKEDGRPWPGGYAAWGLLRSQKYNRSIPEYIDFTKTPEVSDTIVYYWINNEISYNPASAVAYSALFAESARAAGINGAEERIRNAVKFLKNEGSEEALLNAYKITSYTDTAEATSIRKLIYEKYPKGLMAMKDRYDKKFDYRNPEATRKHFFGFVEEFPYTPERDEYLSRYGHGYDDVNCTMMILDWMDGKTDNLESMADSLSFYGCNSAFYKIICISHLRKDKTDAELLPLATKFVERMEELKGQKPASLSYLSDSEWAVIAAKSIESNVAETYSEILKNTGNPEKALEYSKLAQNQAKYMRADINDNMAELLKALNKTSELKALLEKSQYNNQVSPMQTDMLREIYTREHGSSDGFEAYVEQLKNPAEKSAIQKDVEGYRREGVMPEWSLTDADGKTVSSAQLKGKVYVIDFWANWCHPCKASLPGMQLAADHFKDDANVEFLFVDTQEYIPNYKQKARDYLKEKGLDIHLVFDGTREGSDVNDLLSSQVMQQFSTSGIPLKVVVDANGNIRFLAVGYKGSPSALRDEMIEMVEQAKK